MTVFETQENYWDNVAGEKKFTTPFQIDLFQEYVSTDKSILDVGCGYGRTLNELYQCGYRKLSGIDFSLKMIERGRHLYPHMDLRKNKEGTIPFDDRTFDAVIIIAVLTCIIDKNAQEKLIAEANRVLKKGGILYINDFMINTDKRNVERYKAFETKHNHYGIFELPEGAVLKHHTEKEILELTQPFTTIAVEKTTYTTMNGNTSNGFYYIGKNES